MNIVHTINVSGQPLGRVATRIATLLRGKDMPSFEPHRDSGNSVEVVGVKNLKLSGRKQEQKVYHRYSGYPGGLKTENMRTVIEKKPGAILWRAVYQMLPPTRLRKGMMKRLIIKE